jgi:hypothetical protein
MKTKVHASFYCVGFFRLSKRFTKGRDIADTPPERWKRRHGVNARREATAVRFNSQDQPACLNRSILLQF